MSADDEVLGEIRSALLSETGSIKLVLTFTHGRCVQVYQGKRKVGPVLVPAEGQTVADVLHMLGTIATEADA